VSGGALRVALAGNPNVGKTSLFNELTGARHKVGNYAGVTVETREGAVAARWHPTPAAHGGRPAGHLQPDAGVRGRGGRVSLPARRGRRRAPDLVVLVVDAANLARNLYLAAAAVRARVGRWCSRST
jgi:ferrous iron transport protein B